jgi:hypothetical protein
MCERKSVFAKDGVTRCDDPTRGEVKATIAAVRRRVTEEDTSRAPRCEFVRSRRRLVRIA